MTTIFEQLSAPFAIEDIEWRVGPTNADTTKGVALAYITARAVMARLDSVVGPNNWSDEYTAITSQKNGWLCKLSLRIEGEWISKQDGADESDMESIKGGISDALKRAAVKWGIGRYLYDLPNVWVPVEKRGKSVVLLERPRLPDWALPAGVKDEAAKKPASSPKPSNSKDPAPEPAADPEPAAGPSFQNEGFVSAPGGGLVPYGKVIRITLQDIAGENRGKVASDAQAKLAGMLLGQAIPDKGVRVNVCKDIFETDTWSEVPGSMKWALLQWMRPVRNEVDGKVIYSLSDAATKELAQSCIPYQGS